MSLVIGVISKGWAEGWIEGVSILVAVIAVVSVASFNNYVKDQQFQKLVAVSEAKNCMVRRGGELISISVYELVVGDIVKIERGEIMSVDGVAVQAHLILCDESDMTGESDMIEKHTLEEDRLHCNPFFISGTKVLEGDG